MTDSRIAFESLDCTFVLYEDASFNVYDDEGQRIYSGAFTKLDILELSELLPTMQGHRSAWLANDRIGEQ